MTDTVLARDTNRWHLGICFGMDRLFTLPEQRRRQAGILLIDWGVLDAAYCLDAPRYSPAGGMYGNVYAEQGFDDVLPMQFLVDREML